MARTWNQWLWALMSLVGRNWLTLLGATLTTISALLIVAFLLLGLLEVADSPYIGILAFLVLPAVFVGGLLLIPIGLYFDRRKVIERFDERERNYPVIDFNQPRSRHLAGIVIALTIVNLLIISIVSYQGVVYMETVEFCGEVCHSVMEPEHTSYINSPHARVRCVECHIGAGAPWFVRSKLSGVGQVFAVTFNTYDRPIPIPIENLRPSRETCEECHWPQKFTPERLRVFQRFEEDEASTPTKTVLLMHIGGGPDNSGIHGWHMDPRREVRYLAADRQRQTIPWIQVTEADGQTVEYSVEDPPRREGGEERLMDCLDCHNRPTHIFRLPDQAMDQALAEGRIDRSIPFIKKVGTETLRATGPNPGDVQLIEKNVRDYYQANYPDFYESQRNLVDNAITELKAIYGRNVFPRMSLNWGTYPDNIGHERFPGCFRCHDSEHASASGAVVEQDCEKCHTILAQEEQEPEILKQLGVQ